MRRAQRQLALRRGLDRRELELALLDLRDVAGGADHPDRAPVGPAKGDPVLTRPAPQAFLGAIAHVADKARRLALEMLDQAALELRPVGRMNALAPIFGRLQRRGGKPQ